MKFYVIYNGRIVKIRSSLKMAMVSIAGKYINDGENEVYIQDSEGRYYQPNGEEIDDISEWRTED